MSNLMPANLIGLTQLGIMRYRSDMNEPKLADATGATNWGAIFAVSVLSLIPVFALFIAFQRYIVEGISTTGLKG